MRLLLLLSTSRCRCVQHLPTNALKDNTETASNSQNNKNLMAMNHLEVEKQNIYVYKSI